MHHALSLEFYPYYFFYRTFANCFLFVWMCACMCMHITILLILFRQERQLTVTILVSTFLKILLNLPQATNAAIYDVIPTKYGYFSKERYTFMLSSDIGFACDILSFVTDFLCFVILSSSYRTAMYALLRLPPSRILRQRVQSHSRQSENTTTFCGWNVNNILSVLELSLYDMHLSYTRFTLEPSQYFLHLNLQYEIFDSTQQDLHWIFSGMCLMNLHLDHHNINLHLNLQHDMFELTNRSSTWIITILFALETS